MAKLQIYIKGALDEEVVYNKKDNEYIYHRSLKAFEASESTVRNEYQKAIAALSDAISDRLENFPTCSVFKNIVQILDCSKWPEKLKKFVAMVMQAYLS